MRVGGGGGGGLDMKGGAGHEGRGWTGEEELDFSE